LRYAQIFHQAIDAGITNVASIDKGKEPGEKKGKNEFSEK
jgi:hypothetical protein